MELDMEELGYKRIAAMVLIAGILAVLYSLLMGINLVVSFLALLLAVFGSYYTFMSFLQEDTPPELSEGEKIVLRTLDKGSILFPRGVGKLLGKESHRDLSIYLTTRRVIANSRKNERVLDVHLSSVKDCRKEKRLMATYIRLRYIDDSGKDKDALILVGSPEKWIQRIKGLGIGPRVDPGDVNKIKDSIEE